MAMWSSRTSGYKAGVVMLLIGFVLYLIGFALPYWVKSEYGHFGLWLGCFRFGTYTECQSSATGKQAGWFKAWQAMESLGLIGMITCCLYAVLVNCCQSAKQYGQFLQILALLSGGAGFMGCMIFVGKTQEFRSSTAEDYSWAFGFNLTGCLIVLIASAAISLASRSNEDQPPPATAGAVTYAGGVPIQGGNAVVLQQGQSYPLAGHVYPPAQPGTGYGAQPGFVYPSQYSNTTQYSGGYSTAATVLPQAGYSSPQQPPK